MTTKSDYRPSIRETRWLDKLLPQTNFSHNNPVYRYDVRKLKLPDDLMESSISWIINAAVLVFAVWGIFLLLALVMSSYAPAVIDLVGRLMLLFIGLNLLNTLTLDIMAVRTTLKSIDDERAQGRWGLLRISGLRMAHIVQAKHSMAQLNIWHSLCVIIGFRLAILLILPGHAFLLHIAFPQFQLFTPLHFSLPEIADPALMTLIGMAVFVIVGVVWLIEPLWRIRALIAASLVAAGAGSSKNGAQSLIVTRLMMRFNIECSGLLLTMLGLCYVGIMGRNALALSLALLMPVLVYQRYQHVTQLWLRQAEVQLGELES